jgi:hypothetical protein
MARLISSVLSLDCFLQCSLPSTNFAGYKLLKFNSYRRNCWDYLVGWISSLAELVG